MAVIDMILQKEGTTVCSYEDYCPPTVGTLVKYQGQQYTVTGVVLRPFPESKLIETSQYTVYLRKS